MKSGEPKVYGFGEMSAQAIARSVGRLVGSPMHLDIAAAGLITYWGLVRSRSQQR